MAKKAIKFGSFYGIALDAGKDGDEIRVGFQINCNDPAFKDAMPTTVAGALDDIVYPEIMRRVKDGLLTPDFRLAKAHVLTYADESRNEVLLNDDVRFKGLVKFKDGKTFKAGDEVKSEEIQELLGLYPSEKNDPNAAHIMLVKLNSTWRYACDLIYDRDRVRKRFENAKQFFKTAEHALEQKSWGPFVDNLHSVTELSIQSILLLHHNPMFSTNQDHEKTKELFAAHAANGNIDKKFADHYSELSQLRRSGRYLVGLHGNSFTMHDPDSKKLLDLTKELMDHVDKWMSRVDFHRKPPAGEYVAFGRGA